MNRETRYQLDIEAARAEFARVRHEPDRLLRWMAWYRLRALLERWDDHEDGPEIEGAHRLLIEAEAWRRGYRPPASFHEASIRIRAAVARGRLRAGSGGL